MKKLLKVLSILLILLGLAYLLYTNKDKFINQKPDKSGIETNNLSGQNIVKNTGDKEQSSDNQNLTGNKKTDVNTGENKAEQNTGNSKTGDKQDLETSDNNSEKDDIKKILDEKKDELAKSGLTKADIELMDDIINKILDEVDTEK